MRTLIFIASLCLSIPSFAVSYTTMTIEGVKQLDGVWTAAGVLDNTGIIKTTGAVSVYNASASTAISAVVDTSAASKLLRIGSRALGPIALAATAYDVYKFITDDPDIAVSGDAFVREDGEVLEYGKYWGVGPTSCQSSNPLTTAMCYFSKTNFTRDTSCVKVSSNQYNCTSYSKTTSDKLVVGVNSYTCTTQTTSSCKGPQPLTDLDWDSLLGDFPTDVLASGWSKLPSLKGKPVPIKEVKFKPFSTWSSDPYFKDGHWYRDRMDVSPCPILGNPTRVCVSIGPVKFDDATDPQTVPSQATGTASGGGVKEQASFCQENPMSIACAEMGELEPDDIPVTELPINMNTAAWGNSDAQCPAPVSFTDHMGYTKTISYQPVCDFMLILKPILLAIAWIGAIYILLGINKTRGEGQ